MITLNHSANQMFIFICSHLSKEKRDLRSAWWRLLAGRSDAATAWVGISNKESSLLERNKLLLLPHGLFLLIQELIPIA